MNPAEWLARTAKRTPDAPALMTGERLAADYRTFADSASRIAGALTARGVKPGDRVAIFMKNAPEYLEAFYSIWWAGAAAVPINAKLHPKEAAWIIEDAGAEIVFVSEDVGEPLRPLMPACVREVVVKDGPDFTRLYQADALTTPAPVARDDMLWLFYTSGTTGKPKGVMITADNIHAATFSYFADVDEVSRDDAILYAAPMSHGAGLYNFMHVLKGARHVVPETGGFEPAEILALAPKLRNVSMFAAPTMVRRLVDRAKAEGASGDGIKTIVYGGGPMYVADIIDAVAAMGPRFVQIYGQGESPMTITALSRDLVADRTHLRWRERLASVGVAHSCVRVRVAYGDGRTLPPGEIGEILVEGAPVMLGYWRNAEATAKTIRDGWLWTGDMGAIDEDGFVTLHDRSKDLIISGGTNIYPREVEEVLLMHDLVHEVAVVGRVHPDWGEEVVAFVVPSEGATCDPAALDAHCRDHIARFKRPKGYIVVDALPKNNYGKVLKTELRERLAKGTA
jgi:acyl-CoA synthetase (AMP-forming)/AMP-acid ligase II